MNPEIHLQISELLTGIEREMRNLQLWSDDSPAPAAMASRMPFCYDTMQFAQWLQWVLLPRMRIILEERGALPESSDIWPLAEHEFEQLEQDTSQLLSLIRSFDELICART
jgi:uncharacterized protein YqcC (DUF446 family)